MTKIVSGRGGEREDAPDDLPADETTRAHLQDLCHHDPVDLHGLVLSGLLRQPQVLPQVG